MANYVVEVRRISKDSGTLTFKVDGNRKFTTKCWENPGKRIPAKTYRGCSTTHMHSRGWKSVYLPDPQTGRRGIFIHGGTKPSHSEGCIVCRSSKVHEIFDTIGPTNGKNVKVIVRGWDYEQKSMVSS
jgi:hypothetical protein